MTGLEKELYWEMVRAIRLLGAKEDILGYLGMMDSALTEGEAVQEIITMVKCWNDKVEKTLENIPESIIYKEIGDKPCG